MWKMVFICVMFVELGIRSIGFVVFDVGIFLRRRRKYYCVVLVVVIFIKLFWVVRLIYLVVVSNNFIFLEWKCLVLFRLL